MREQKVIKEALDNIEAVKEMEKLEKLQADEVSGFVFAQHSQLIQPYNL